jgi:acetyl-CoA C-acetyltransferase
VHELARTKGRYGIATLCVSGGQGMAVLVERV